MSEPLIDPCSLEPNHLLTLDETLAIIKASIQPVRSTEWIPLYDALGRVLADDVTSPINIPYDRNSAMDGYALASNEIKENQPFTLTLVGTSWAGKPYLDGIKAGQCVRIFTGAVVPEGADSVVIQEQVTVLGDTVSFPTGIKPCENIRALGEEIRPGNTLCKKGSKLSPADIGLLAAAGICQIPVCSIIHIAYFSTGDELVPLGQALEPGKIYESNRYVLDGLLADSRFDSVDMGIYEDDKRKLKNRIRRMSQMNDVIISTGGASVGEADYINEVLAKLGDVKVWKIAIKPGKPLIFGTVGPCYYFGLPGNPVSMMVTFSQIVAPALDWLSGATPRQPLRLKAICTAPLKKSPGRMEFQRGILSQDAIGNLNVVSTGSQGSHILSSMSKANCYIVLPAESKGANPGDMVEIEPFDVFI